MPEFYKDDNASMETWKNSTPAIPKTAEPMVTKICYQSDRLHICIPSSDPQFALRGWSNIKHTKSNMVAGRL